MSHIEISKDGILEYSWDSDRGATVSEKLRPERIFHSLRMECWIVEGTTLGDLFSALDQYPTLKDFLSLYSWCPHLEACHAQARESTRTQDNEPIDHLEIYRAAEFFESEDGNYFDYRCEFGGVGYVEDRETFKEKFGYDCPKDGIIHYGVGLTPMYDLADLPLKIVSEFEVSRNYDPDQIVFRAEGSPSFLEVLDAIYDEISDYGSPEEKEVIRKNVKSSVQEIREELESGTFETGERK